MSTNSSPEEFLAKAEELVAAIRYQLHPGRKYSSKAERDDAYRARWRISAKKYLSNPTKRAERLLHMKERYKTDDVFREQQKATKRSPKGAEIRRKAARKHYQKIRSNPELRAALNARQAAYARGRYAADPDYRAKLAARRRARYLRKKQQIAAVSVMTATAPVPSSGIR